MRKRTLPLRKTMLTLRKRMLPMRKTMLTLRTRTLPLRKTSLPLRKRMLAMRNGTFSTLKTTDPLRNGTRQILKNAFIAQKSDLFVRWNLSPASQAPGFLVRLAPGFRKNSTRGFILSLLCSLRQSPTAFRQLLGAPYPGFRKSSTRAAFGRASAA